MFALRFVAIFAAIHLSTVYSASPQEINFDENRIRSVQDSHAPRWQFHNPPHSSQSSDIDVGQDDLRPSQRSRAVSPIMPSNNQNSVSSDQAQNVFNTNPYQNAIEHSQYNSLKNGLQKPQTTGPISIQGSLLSPNLEMVLRQASGDESVFQPSPTIGAVGHDTYDWASGPRLISNLKTGSTANSSRLEPISNKNIQANNSSTEPVQKVLTSSATDRPGQLWNVPNDNAANNQMEPVILNHQQSVSSHQKEYQTDGNTSLEFNNQVIYEGPATPPSAASADDYYLSSSEKQPTNKEIINEHSNELPHSNAWCPLATIADSEERDFYDSSSEPSLCPAAIVMALGLEGEFERVNNLTRNDYVHYCDRSPLLINNKQRSLCRMHPRVMSVVARGLRLAFDECQTRFTTSRWNCSLVVANWLSSDHLKAPSVFGDVMRKPNRERSFLNSIIAAGLAHSMTKACSQGELPEECSCDRKIKSKNNKGRVEWVACSDDIDYGARFSRDFTDNFDANESEDTSTIYIHNSEVGRRVFKSATDITCTCLNGENGLCQTKRCWKHLGSYSDIVEELVKRYEGATHVQRSNKDPHKLRPVRRGVRKPKRKDLVFIEESPDYCQQDFRMGILGTRGRHCDSTSQGADSCSLLCCGRGYQTVVDQIEEDCNCKFVWCCQVKCDKCKRFVTNEICN